MIFLKTLRVVAEVEGVFLWVVGRSFLPCHLPRQLRSGPSDKLLPKFTSLSKRKVWQSLSLWVRIDQGYRLEANLPLSLNAV